ncbi:MAG: arginine--tRNA ligase [Ruminococcus sp.]|jgi:arginyl-tRNA synthetase|nr:arginine--tRNA ligase [Ruminococcus sp.]
MNLIEKAEQQIKSVIDNVLKKHNVEINYIIEIPADKSFGDFAANVAMVGAKVLKMPPVKIAEMLIAEIDLSDTYCKSVSVAGPGFINFSLSDSWYIEVLQNILDEKQNYGKAEPKNKKILVEFVSANPTGPMHIGNARGGAIGDTLAETLSWAGYDVEREFYINDAGNQIDKFAMSLDLRYLQIYDSEVELPEDAYQGEDIKTHAKNFDKLFGDKYVSADEKTRRKALVDFALPLNIAELKTDLKKYEIEYDTWFPESRLHKENEVDRVIDILKARGYTYESDGALWFNGDEYSVEDFVLVRATGVPTYVVPDIAYHYNKLVTRGFDFAIDIFGADHHGYVPRLRASLKALGIDDTRLSVILMQMVRLVSGGETVKLSKRSGKAITLSTLLEEVPIDAARFFFNLREANTHFDFDLDLAIQNNNENPVFYVEYAHARICSLLDLFDNNDNKVTDLTLLKAPQETALIKQLALLPSEIEKVAESYNTARLTKYAIETASLFHKFYDVCSIRYAESDDLKTARLSLCKATKTVIFNVLALMKITAPDSM